MWDSLLKSRIFWISLLIVATLGVIVLIWWMMRPTDQTEQEESEPTNEANQGNKSQIIARMYNYLTDKGVERNTALFIIAQAMHETGVFTSSLAKNYNNLFGMKQPQRRETTSIGPTTTGYASFNSIEDSIQDLILWLAEFNAPETFGSNQSYVSFLKSKGYFEDTLTNYMSATNKHLNTIKNLS